MIFKWKPKVSIPVDPQVAGEEIVRLTEENGGNVTAPILLKSATRKSSPLHPAFEWDDKEAARLHREDQARYILRSIVIVTNEGEEEDEETLIRAFIHSESEEAYLTIYRAMADDDLRTELIARAWKELQDWTNRYQELTEFANIVMAVEREKRKRRRKKAS